MVGTGRPRYMVYILDEVLRGRSSSNTSTPGRTGLWQWADIDLATDMVVRPKQLKEIETFMKNIFQKNSSLFTSSVP